MVKKRLSAVAVSCVALLVGIAAPAAAVPETELKPARLDRGADIAVPHLVGKTVVDGDVRVRIRAGRVRLLGAAGDDYVVGTAGTNGIGRFRLLRVTADGERTVLLRDVDIWELVLADDGGVVVGSTYRRRDPSTRLRVFSTTDGHLVAARRFAGSVSALDGDGDTLVLGGWGPNRTLTWDTGTDATRQLLGRTGYGADLGADRVATFTRDPYNGGCTVLTTLSTPRERLWESCEEKVYALAPDGARMATVHILSDGLGPSDVLLRRAGGKALAHYSAEWFGAVWWESDRALLLDTNGTEKSATVRCEVTDCERASALRPRPVYRVTTPGQRSARP